MQAMKKTKMTVTRMAKIAKKQILNLFSVGKKMMTKGQVMKIMSRAVKERSGKGTHLVKK